MAERKKKSSTTKKKVAGKMAKKDPVKNTQTKKDIVDGLYDYAKMLDKSMPNKEYFGKGLYCARSSSTEKKGSNSSLRIKVYKGKTLIGQTSVWPVHSCENGGLFYVDSEDGKGVQYVDLTGRKHPRVYGKDSASMSSGFARVEIIDEPFEDLQSVKQTKKGARLFTFIKLGKDCKILTMKARFSEACFIDPCGLGRVVVAGERNLWTYVDTRGKVLPYRFAKADECFRNGMARVTLFDGTSALIGRDGHIYKRRASGKIVHYPEGEKLSSIYNTEIFTIDEKGLVHNIKREQEIVAKTKAKKKIKIEVESPLKAENEDVEITIKNKNQKDIILF